MSLTDNDRATINKAQRLAVSLAKDLKGVSAVRWRTTVQSLLALIVRLQTRERAQDVEVDRLSQALRDVARHHAAGDRVTVRFVLDDAGFGRSW